MSGSERTIAVVTSSRADWAHLVWVLRELATHPGVDVRLLVTGAHLSPRFGSTVDVIERDGFRVAERIDCLVDADTDAAMAETIGHATIGFGRTLDRLRPDLLVVTADRYEMLAPAAAALALRIPIAHIEGGDVSEGAIDHAVRNALTMLSHVHFAPTAAAAARLVGMGEAAWRVHHVGTPSLDHLRHAPPLAQGDVEAALGLDLTGPTIVVGWHPVTLDRDTTAEAGALFDALGRRSERLVFCHPNADAGGLALRRRIDALVAARPNAHLFTNLEPPVYWGLLACASAIVGNSSSVVMESPALRLPAVCVGKRQQGRERAANVIDAPADAPSITAAIDRALTPAFCAGLDGLENPYGDGHAAQRIADVLARVALDQELLMKRAT